MALNMVGQERVWESVEIEDGGLYVYVGGDGVGPLWVELPVFILNI